MWYIYPFIRIAYYQYVYFVFHKLLAFIRISFAKNDLLFHQSDYIIRLWRFMQIYSFIKVTKRMKFTEDLYHLVEYYNEYCASDILCIFMYYVLIV